MSITIFTGNIGSGKSLIASKFAKNGSVIVNMDSIQQMIGGGEYGLYDVNKKDIYHNAEESIIKNALAAGLSVVVDRTNMDIKKRANFIKLGKLYGSQIISYDFGKGTDAGLNRRLLNPHGVPKKTWIDVYSYMKKSYIPPTYDEGFDTIIKVPDKFKFFAVDFDGTIVQNTFPEIGEVLSGVVDKLNQLWNDLSNIIIIWSCRSENYENEMRAFLLKNKIPFDFINENPIFNPGGRKIFAHKYIDDRNVEFNNLLK